MGEERIDKVGQVRLRTGWRTGSGGRNRVVWHRPLELLWFRFFRHPVDFPAILDAETESRASSGRCYAGSCTGTSEGWCAGHLGSGVSFRAGPCTMAGRFPVPVEPRRICLYRQSRSPVGLPISTWEYALSRAKEGSMGRFLELGPVSHTRTHHLGVEREERNAKAGVGGSCSGFSGPRLISSSARHEFARHCSFSAGLYGGGPHRPH